MPVEPDAFVAAMSHHWQTTLRNVTSSSLEAVWHQMASTFNHQIATAGTPGGQRWKVLQPATGTGKSQGLAVYCAMLPPIAHPGVLIVTRLKSQADEIARTVNILAGEQVSVAYHGDTSIATEALIFCPVLVITHRAYEIGMDAINRGQPNVSNWSRYHAWGEGTRKLVVIDEALDIIEEAQIDLSQVKFVQAVIPFTVAEDHPAEMNAIATLEDILVRIARLTRDREKPERERVLALAMPNVFDMTPLRRALKDIRLDQRLLHRRDDEQNRKLRKHYDTILRDIQATLENWSWYAKKLGDHTMNTARLIVPDDINGAVILDATASSNLIYKLFDSRVDIVPVPSKARAYGNVTLHVSVGHAVGKSKMVKAAKEEGPRLVANLKATLGQHRKVFVCCHQFVEPQLVSLDTGFDKFEVGHWNAIDGRNDWQDFDTAVIFGLPYRDKAWSANTFMALRGLQDTAWLNSEGDRPFENYRDVRHSLEIGQLVVNIVQAINRVRCRRVVDATGDCLPTDVFILLPSDTTGREVLASIKLEMPGINVVAWNYAKTSTTTRKPRRSHHGEALIRYAGSMRDGRRSVSDIRRHLSIPASSWERLAADIRNPGSDLCKALVAHGVAYSCTRVGKTQRAYLAKG